MEKIFEKLLPYEVAHTILGDYVGYHHQFKRITKRGKIRFETRDWRGMQADATLRIDIYRDIVGKTTEKVEKLLGDDLRDLRFWLEVKDYYTEDILNFHTRNIAETFYNSVFRHLHRNRKLGADPHTMFVHATSTYREFKSSEPIFHRFLLGKSLPATFHYILSHYPLDAPFEDLDRDISRVVEKLTGFLAQNQSPGNSVRLELLKAMFFRNEGAYIVGRLIVGRTMYPFILPLLHEAGGVYIDSLILDSNEASSIFSYHRSYFLVDVDIVSEMVDFLKSILPTKGLGELYNSIGFEKHGKTVFYRDLIRFLHQSEDTFVVAPGIRGMVMAVFTLPSYNVVFKVIKDRFESPKKVTEAEVKQKYELVHQHDRVGRMTDFHVFENLQFERARFAPELLEELREVAGSKVKINEDTVEITHLYVEKKLTPLNLYLEKATPEAAEKVIDEYGIAIKELAAANIFPGDMLLKNFGVTRLQRVVFYDYDEIGFLTDYNFRKIPESRDDFDEYSADPWFSVGPNDVFPEEFKRFLIGRKEIREIFYRLHGDLFDVDFWQKTQERLRRGELITVLPYRHRIRFEPDRRRDT